MAGCVSLDMSSPHAMDGMRLERETGAPVRHVVVRTSAWTVLWLFPIMSGHIVWNENTKRLETKTEFFTSDISLQEIHDAFAKYAQHENCNLIGFDLSDASSAMISASYEGAACGLFGISDASVCVSLVQKTNGIPAANR